MKRPAYSTHSTHCTHSSVVRQQLPFPFVCFDLEWQTIPDPRGNQLITAAMLQTGLPDHRKYVISIVLVPYFINIKHLSEKDATSKINQWLSKCSTCKPLDSTYDFDSKLKYYINRCEINSNLKPIRFDRLFDKSLLMDRSEFQLYNLLIQL